MFKDFSKQIKERIQRDMKDQFGLSDKESEQSIQIMLEKVRDFFSEATLKGNFDQIRTAIQDWSKDSGALKEKFNRDVLQDLIQKVGLSEEKAARVKDFSMDALMKEFRTRFAELEGKMDLNALIDKIKPDQIEGSARELLDNMGKLFKGKS